jgi:hypothetical protein
VACTTFTFYFSYNAEDFVTYSRIVCH